MNWETCEILPVLSCPSAFAIALFAASYAPNLTADSGATLTTLRPLP